MIGVTAPVFIKAFGVSDVGLVRSNNEDSFLLTDRSNGLDALDVPDVPDMSVATLGSGYNQLLLSYRVCLARADHRRSSRSWRESIKLSTEEKFEALDTSILVLEETDQLKKEYGERCLKLRQKVAEKSGETSEADHSGIGYISYVAAFNDRDGLDSSPAFCMIRVLVPKVTFDELLTVARLGRIPSYIIVGIEGMEYGGSPDGSAKKWDNKTFPELAVNTVSFHSIPLAAQPLSNEPDGGPNRRLAEMQSELFLPTRSQLNEISTKLDVLAIETTTGFRYLLWGILVIAVLILILFLLRH